MESFHSNAPVIGRVLKSSFFIASIALVSCTPAPEPKEASKSLVKVTQITIPTQVKPLPRAAEPKPIIIPPPAEAPAQALEADAPILPLPRVGEMNRLRQLDGDLASDGPETKAEVQVQARVNEELKLAEPEKKLEDKKIENRKVEAASASSSSLPTPITIVQSSSSSTSSAPLAENPLGHPTAKLPLPEDVRQEAGKALKQNEVIVRKPNGTVAKVETKPDHARARLGENAVKENKMGTVSNTPFFLEALFISIVLICLVGAMWFRMRQDFGPKRRK